MQARLPRQDLSAADEAPAVQARLRRDQQQPPVHLPLRSGHGADSDDAIVQAVLAASLEEAAGVPMEAIMAAAAAQRVAAADPAAPQQQERLQALILDASGEFVEAAGLKRLLEHSDGQLEQALSLYLDSPESYRHPQSDAARHEEDTVGAANSIEGVWSADLSLLTPDEAFGADAPAAAAEKGWLRGDRVILPHAALSAFLDALAASKGTRTPPTPICMRLQFAGGVARVCGIADWAAPSGRVILPRWLLADVAGPLGRAAASGDRLRVISADVPRATALVLRPRTHAARQLPKPRQVEVLTRGIQNVFTNVRVGDQITIDGDGGGTFEVLACRGKYDAAAASTSSASSSSTDARARGAAAKPAAKPAGKLADDATDARGGVSQKAVCVVASDNGVLEFDLEVEESVERLAAREAFDSARDAYRAVLEASRNEPRAIVDDPRARERLKTLVQAADAAAAAGCALAGAS